MSDLLLKKEHTTIAVIEDDSDLLMLIQDYLTDEGYRVLAYSDGISFAAAMKSKLIVPNIIVTDIEMPFKSGIETLYELSLRMNIKDIPVIFLTGKQDDITINNAFENNIEHIHYMLKPVNFVLLHMTIRKMLLLAEYYNSIVHANKELLKVSQQLKSQKEKADREKEFVYNRYLNEQEQLKQYLDDITKNLNNIGRVNE